MQARAAAPIAKLLVSELGEEWTVRFTKVSPAAVEVHVTMSALDDRPSRITLGWTRKQSAPSNPGCRTRRPFIENRDYEHRRFFAEAQSAGGFFIVRGNRAIQPTEHESALSAVDACDTSRASGSRGSGCPGKR